MDKDKKFNYEKFVKSLNDSMAQNQQEKAEKMISKKLKKWDKIRKEELDKMQFNPIKK